MWKRLEHPNIVSLLGVTLSPFQFVSVWMPGGELLEYIDTHPSVDRLGLVGFDPIPLDGGLTLHQVSGVADGLSYLHSYGVVHGDLKGVREHPGHPQNVLICVLAKYSCGRCRSCTSHRLWPSHCRSGQLGR